MEHELTQAKQSLITHIAALTALEKKGGGGQDQGREKVLKLEAENTQLMQGKIQMENICKKEIGSLLQRLEEVQTEKEQALQEARHWEQQTAQLQTQMNDGLGSNHQRFSEVLTHMAHEMQ